MNIKKIVRNILEKLGLTSKKLHNYLDVAEDIAKGLLNVISNPIVEGILEIVLPKTLSKHLPQLENVLEKAVIALTIGSHIEEDIANAATVEEKLKVFALDLQKYGIDRKNMFIAKLVSLIIAGLDDKTLKQNMYDLFSQANYTLIKSEKQ